MAVQPGQKFDRYSIEELVGEGGMGRVYRAFDTRLERSVALKILYASGDTAESVAIALREARAAAAIAHPNATAVYDAHEIEGTSFIAMEFVAGTSLRTLIHGPHVPLPTRLRWLIDIAAALNAAHRMGVVHRDVKPENVMVRHDGLVKVLDFGVARRIVLDPPEGGAPSFHVSGARIAGTPAYMAPEQIRGEEIDGRADQFSWGVLAYELVTGHLPWRTAKDVVGYIAAIVTEDPLPPSTINPAVPPAVDTTILRALEKNPANRHTTMLTAAADLARYARASLSMEAIGPIAVAETATPPVSAPVPSPPRPAPRESAPSSSRPPPLSSGARMRPDPEVASRPPSRRRWPFGSGFHEPDFEAPVDLEAHLLLIPPESTCKGLFFNDVLQQASKVTSELDLLKAAQLTERRFVGFRDYPLGEHLRLDVAAARVLYPRYPLGEGLRRMGQTVFDALLGTHVGRTIFGALGRDVEPILLSSPQAFKLLMSTGQITCEKTDYRTYTLHALSFPAFLETYEVGVLEGILRYCGERGRIRIAIDDLGAATFELRLL